MNDLRQAAQQALEAMLNFPDDISDDMFNSIAALRAALAEPDEQEPVAWRTFDGEGGYDYRSYEMNEDYGEWWKHRHPNHQGWVEALYTAPPQRKPLTEGEIEKAYTHIYSNMPNSSLDKRFAWVEQGIRYAEAAHGIKEGT